MATTQMSEEETQVSEEETQQPVDNTKTTGYLPWPEDLQMISQYLDKKATLIEDHSQFVKDHPELSAILSDFMQGLLIHKPDDIYQFAYQFFSSYSTIIPPDPSHLSHYDSSSKNI